MRRLLRNGTTISALLVLAATVVGATITKPDAVKITAMGPNPALPAINQVVQWKLTATAIVPQFVQQEAMEQTIAWSWTVLATQSNPVSDAFNDKNWVPDPTIPVISKTGQTTTSSTADLTAQFATRGFKRIFVEATLTFTGKDLNKYVLTGLIVLQVPVDKLKVELETEIIGVREVAGKLRTTDALNTQENKQKIGTIVIADMDNVYTQEDTKERAQRRMVKVIVADGKSKVLISRTSTDPKMPSDLKLFDTKDPKKGEMDRFEQAKGNQFVYDPVKDQEPLWLQGGAPRKGVRDQLITAQLVTDKKSEDELAVTVLWVDISGSNTGSVITDGKPGNPVYDDLENLKANFGHTTLGVQRNLTKASDDLAYNGAIEIFGSIRPKDFDMFYANRRFTTINFQGGRTKPASADLGFVFEREKDLKRYAYGQSKATNVDTGRDDSTRSFQDPDPDPGTINNTTHLLIVDVDGPNLIVADSIVHMRGNLKEHVVFYFKPEKPERCSRAFPWAVSIDLARGGTLAKSRAVEIIAPANLAGAKTNIVLIDKNLTTTEIVDPKDPVIKAPKVTGANPKELARNKVQFTAIEGENLIGEFALQKEKGAPIAPDFLFSAVNPKINLPNFSESKLVIFVLKTDAPAGKNYELKVSNVTGKATLGGFELIDKK
jgi:hypothetical protein